MWPFGTAVSVSKKDVRILERLGDKVNTNDIGETLGVCIQIVKILLDSRDKGYSELIVRNPDTMHEKTASIKMNGQKLW
jgi:hypothetical protein